MQQRIGPYELLERLGSGGMGAVYRARRDDTGQVVALKVMREDLAEDSSFMKRFAREATIARSVDSPNIVRVVDVGQEGYLPYIAMELVDGESLASLIRKAGALTVDLAVDIATQVAQGLHDAQKAGIIHRDISPQNILITDDGTAKIADFGIARSQTTATLTSAGSFIGKPTYAPPEMLEGRADTRSDIYSLGVVMFEMLSGRPPFIAPTPLATMDMHARQEPPRLSLLGVRTPPRLDEIIRKCLAKDPVDRFQTPAELLWALRGMSQAEVDATIVASTPVSEATRVLDADVTVAQGAGRGRTPPPAPPRGGEGPRRWPMLLAAAGLGTVAFAVAAAATYWVTRSDEAGSESVACVPTADDPCPSPTPSAFPTEDPTPTPNAGTPTPVFPIVGSRCEANLPDGAAAYELPAAEPDRSVVAALNCGNATFVQAAASGSAGPLSGAWSGQGLACYEDYMRDLQKQNAYEIDELLTAELLTLEVSGGTARATSKEAWDHERRSRDGVLISSGPFEYDNYFELALAGERWVITTNTDAFGAGNSSCPATLYVGAYPVVAQTGEICGGRPCRLGLRPDPGGTKKADGSANPAPVYLEPGTNLQVVGGPVVAEGYRWWNVKVLDGSYSGRQGWSAELSQDGTVRYMAIPTGFHE